MPPITTVFVKNAVKRFFVLIFCNICYKKLINALYITNVVNNVLKLRIYLNLYTLLFNEQIYTLQG